MAFSANTIWEVRTAGSDTACSGGFNPSNANLVANKLSVTDGTTAAPKLTHASYTFVAGDIGAWAFIQSGTNWIPGWYKIDDVITGVATLNATIGTGVLYLSSTAIGLSTATGCVTGSYVSGTASAKGSVDYSQQSAAEFSFTDIVIDAVTNTDFTSAGFPVGQNMLGNIINVTAGTGFTVQMVEVATIPSGVIGRADKSLGTTGSTGGTGYLGGAFASIGQAGKQKILCPAGAHVYVGTGTYTLGADTANTATGPYSDTVGGAAGYPSTFEGYGTYRKDKDMVNRPVISVGARSTLSVIATSGGACHVENIAVSNPSAGASVTGFSITGTRSYVKFCKASQATLAGISIGTSASAHYCEVTAGTGGAVLGGINFGSGCVLLGCVSHANTTQTPGFYGNGSSGSALISCIADGNTGTTADGFTIAASGPTTLVGCVAYNNGRHGINVSGSGDTTAYNCVAEGNVAASAYGFTSTAAAYTSFNLRNCAGYNNSASPSSATNVDATTPRVVTPLTGFVHYSATAFTSAGTGDFSLNATAGGGASLRAAGFGTLGRTTTVGTPDIGAAQHADPVGGGGMIVHPGMTGGIRG